MTDQYVTIAELAEAAGESRRTIERRIREGRIAVVRRSERCIRIRTSTAAAYLSGSELADEPAIAETEPSTKTRESTTWVYVFSAPHAVKIGITERVEKRAKAIELMAGMKITIVESFPFASVGLAFDVETVAHWLLRDKRTIGEWFDCEPGEALAAVGAASSEHVRAEYLRWKEAEKAET